VRRAIVLLALAACGVDADPGLEAQLRVAGAQYYAGAPPVAATDISITAIDSLNNTIRAGQIDKSLSGRVASGGRAVAIYLAGDTGYWIVPAGAADINFPDELTWSAKASFARDLVAGDHDVEILAVDASGQLGAPRALTLTARDRALDLAGTQLAVSLTWDTEADLDLHLVLPVDPQIIVWWGHPTSYVAPAPGEPVDPNAIAAAGVLETDSNRQCLIDGRREEDIVWRGAPAIPPHGSFTVLVDTFSLCAAPTAHWTVEVFAQGSDAPIGHAEGTVIDSDTRGEHIAGSGVRALVFDL
jgi:hypothetical protein